jgi:hypothetical protein
MVLLDCWWRRWRRAVQPSRQGRGSGAAGPDVRGAAGCRARAARRRRPALPALGLQAPAGAALLLLVLPVLLVQLGGHGECWGSGQVKLCSCLLPAAANESLACFLWPDAGWAREAEQPLLAGVHRLRHCLAPQPAVAAAGAAAARPASRPCRAGAVGSHLSRLSLRHSLTGIAGTVARIGNARPPA